MLIFLDLDGVLVPERRFDPPGPGDTLLAFDQECLAHFEGVLAHYPAAEVVISSSWREVFTFGQVQPLFSPAIRPRVLGFTPLLPSSVIHGFQYLRHQEVLAYLRHHGQVERPWVAVDDIPEHYPPEVSIVVTDAYTGFDHADALLLSLFLSAGSND